VEETNFHETKRLLQGTVDALVSGFHLDESAAEFELVCELASPFPGATRSFVRFRFCGVRQFERSPGRLRKLREVGTTFVGRRVEGAWSVQTVRTAKPGTLRVVSISLGEAFGGIAFRYMDATHEVVHVYAKKKGSDEWDYFEVGTDRPVDFYNPFASSWAEETRR
jgi:hypothetical protein